LLRAVAAGKTVLKLPAVAIVGGGKRAISASSQPKKKLPLIRGKDLEKKITGR
jgi:hypothetical protein